MMMRSALHKTNMLSWIFILLAQWNNSLQVDMLLHSTWTHVPDSKPTGWLSWLIDWLIDVKHQSINQSTKPTSFHSYSLMLPARWKSSQYQFYSHWFYTNRTWNQRSTALEQACQSVHVVATMRWQYLIYVWAFLLDLKYMVVVYGV